MKSLETLKFERLVKINLGIGMDSENAENCAKNQIDRENLQFSQRLNKEPKNEHFTNYDGVQKR